MSTVGENPRHPAGWRGLCLIAGVSTVGHDFGVIDISHSGSRDRVALPGTFRADGLAWTYPRYTAPSKIRFEGPSGHAVAPTAEGIIRVAIESLSPPK